MATPIHQTFQLNQRKVSNYWLQRKRLSLGNSLKKVITRFAVLRLQATLVFRFKHISCIFHSDLSLLHTFVEVAWVRDRFDHNKAGLILNQKAVASGAVLQTQNSD